MNLQYFVKKYLRETKIIEKYWETQYEKANKSQNKEKQIKLINQLNLYERKSIISPKINRVIWINLNKLKYFYYNKDDKPLERDEIDNKFIISGNWDRRKKKIFPDYYTIKSEIGAIGFRTMFQLFEKGINYNLTDEYKKKVKYKTKNELKEIFKNYNITFNKIKTHGYKTQKQLGQTPKGRKIYDEIRIAIDRNGEFGYLCTSGNHRLAMANILKLDKIPVIVDCIHKDYISKKNNDILKNINKKLKEISLN